MRIFWLSVNMFKGLFRGLIWKPQNNTNLFGEIANCCALYYHAIDDDLTAAGCGSIRCQILSLLYWVSLENLTAINHLILKRPKKISSITL